MKRQELEQAFSGLLKPGGYAIMQEPLDDMMIRFPCEAIWILDQVKEIFVVVPVPIFASDVYDLHNIHIRWLSKIETSDSLIRATGARIGQKGYLIVFKNLALTLPPMDGSIQSYDKNRDSAPDSYLAFLNNFRSEANSLYANILRVNKGKI